MKKLLLLLTLSFFSIQGFAAGCPDGSEPVKSLSADGTYFVFECNNNTQNSSSANQNYDITIVNKSSFPTKTLQEWADSASSKMASRESNIFVFIYDVGEIIEPIQEFGPGHLHQVLMSPNEINESYQMIEDWSKNNSCGYIDYELLGQIKEGLERGVDWSSQWSVCTEERLVGMGITDNMRNNPGGRDAFYADLQEFLQHELYHAFQHDLTTEGECRNKADKRDSNSRWMIEGGARFFAKNLLDDNKSFDSHILQEIYERKMGREAFEGESDKAGSAALLLMSKRGLINESEILDGSLFHDCARELKFDKNSSEIKFILKNWNNIIRVSEEEYEFSPEVLLDYDPSKPSKVEYKEDATSEEYPTVDYNTNLLEICKRDVEGNWKNDIKNASYMFAVAGEDGRCEYGLGDTENGAFEECTKWQEENNIVGTCELYGKDGEVVWDSHLKPSK